MTQSLVKEIFDYNPISGVLSWKVATGNSKAGKVIKSTKNRRYTRVTYKGIEYLVHRLVFLYMIGRFPEEIDHINGDSLDNRWKNLREVTPTMNKRNRKKLSNNTSGYTGVIWDKSREKWKVIISFEPNKSVNLGRFLNIEDAIICRDNALLAAKYYTDRHGK